MSEIASIMESERRERRRIRLDERLHMGERNSGRMTARQIADHVFMDCIALWIMSNIFEFAPVAKKYAERARSGRFDRWRNGGTDLQNSVHIVHRRRTDMYRTAADRALLNKVKLNPRTVTEFLGRIASGRITEAQARVSLQRLESELMIESSDYRSVRRLAQGWPGLTTSQRRTVITRMNYFYNANARRAELASSVANLGKSQNLLDFRTKNPERPSVGKVVAAHTAAIAAGAAVGWLLGKRGRGR